MAGIRLSFFLHAKNRLSFSLKARLSQDFHQLTAPPHRLALLVLKQSHVV